jgi:ketosteroid isomerase-like protein
MNSLYPMVHALNLLQDFLETGGSPTTSSSFREGDIDAFETVTRVVTPELAYVVWVERHRSKIGERDEIVSFPLRVTIIIRLEDDTWKIVHRHTDTVISSQPHESMIKE